MSTSSNMDGIAIIGMSGRFPGAKSVEQFWYNLANGVDTISRFRPEELEYRVADSARPGGAQKYVAARGVLEDADQFDAAFFGMYPREAEVTDPQHRLLLECAWEALESAGYDPEAFPGLIGVFAGQACNTYLLYNLCRDRAFAADFAGHYQVGGYQVLVGNDKDFLPTRVSYKLNLRGPSIAVQCCCSTSLVAVCQACTSLLTYQTDMVLAGGVSITFPQKRDYLYSEGGMVSADGTCRAFDAEALGTVFGHGVAIVLLKRLADAVQDGDNILAVIKGTALNNDGSAKIGYAAPSITAQAEVIAMAQAAAGVSPESITYLEAHGTGTPLGDPIEVAGLTQAFRNGGATRKGYCALGSAKTFVSHLDVAAGATGLIKTVLQLQHELIPPLLHFKSPNPQIDFANSPFFPVTKLLDWKRGDAPRRAGVSAFGVGGTNAHVVVEEAPLPPKTSPSRPHQLLVLSAKTETALTTMTSNLAAHLEQHPEAVLPDVAFTLHKGRRAFAHRRAVVVHDRADAIAKLKSADSKSVSTGQSAQDSPEVVMLFPGQGAQYADMGRGLYEHEPVFRSEVDRCAEILQRHLNRDVRHVLYPESSQRTEAERQINETWMTQPAIFVVEYALARLWMSWGVNPSVVIGHSIGEYVCAVLAETFALEDALALLSIRARLMQALPGGSMLAVRRSGSEIEPLLPSGASVAALNSPSLCTVSGPTELLQAIQRDLETKKIAARLLPTSHAFHSAMMDPMLPEFTSAAQKTPHQTPKLRWVSTATGKGIVPEDLADGSYWARQLRHTVRFADALGTVIGDPHYLLLETGPGQSLSQLARQHPSKPATSSALGSLSAASDPTQDYTAMLGTLGRLWIAGVKPDWDRYYGREVRRRVPLPTYPFERKRYWVEPPKQDATASLQPCADSLAAPEEPSTADTCPPQETAVEVQPASSGRRQQLAVQLKAAIKELSGIDISDDTKSFMELGFDSLFLTQASQAFQARFGVKVTFRQMLDELSTVSAVAEYLDQHLPAETAISASAAPLAQPAPARTEPGKPGGGEGPLEQLIRQQMHLMQELLGHQRGASPTVAGVTSGSLPVVKWPGGRVPSSSTAAAGSEFKRFGPYKPIEKGERGGLTPGQQRALDDLLARYQKKTPGSKQYTAEHRPHFADPRAVAGFKTNWKEMVYPIVCARSKGGKIWDVDGNEYVDITLGFGTNFLGHSPDWLLPALEEQLHTGFEIGPQNPVAGKVAKLISDFTGLDRVTFCNTGSEAVMAAIRLARTVTGRKRVVYFTGDYHGMFEEVLVRGSWVNGEYRAQPIAPGIPPSLVENMLVLDYGMPESLEILKAHGSEIAAVLVEPVQSRQPGLQPREFIQEVRAITERCGAALILDEVVTGFRCHPGGAQAYFGVRTDLAAYGKVVGGGLPIGVLAGKRAFMDALDGGAWDYGDDSFPSVGVTFFAGTFVRHPLAMAAAWRVMNFLKEQGPRLQLSINDRVGRVCRCLNEHFERIEVPIRLPHFSSYAMIDHAQDLKFASLLWYYLRDRGIHVWEGRPCFFSIAHTDDDCDRIIRAFKDSVAEMQDAGFLPESPAGTDRLGLPAPGAPEYPRVDRSPLTEAQHEIFFSVQMGDEANCAYNEANTIHFTGELNVPLLETAVSHLVERHPALRSTFSADGQWQLFHPAPAKLAIPQHDFSGLPPAEAQARLDALCAVEPRTPFDLEHGPLLRVQLVRLARDRHVLIWTAHHMVCDGWSFGMVMAEMAASYNALVADRVPMLAPPMPFGDYARRLFAEKDSESNRAAEVFWVNQFADGAPTLELPTDRPRPVVKTYRGDMASRVMDPERFERLKQVTPKLGGTLFATLLADFATLLHRLSGQEDLVIGVPAAGQTMVGCSELIGHCLNFLPMRLRFGGDSSFASFAKAVKAAVLDAYDHQSLTYGSLVQKLKLPRDTSRLPLVSVMFNIDKAGLDLLKFTGLDFQVATNAKQFVNFDLFFNLIQNETTIEVECEYNMDLFDRVTIQRWLEMFETLIEGSIVAAETKMSQLPLLSDPERRRILVEWNQTERDYPRDATIHGLFEAQANASPEKIAARCGAQTFTYSQLAARANALAARLIAESVRPGVLVGLCVERSLDMVVGVLGILKAGAAYVPMDPAYPTERLRMILEDGAMPMIVIQSALAAQLPAHTARLVKMEDLPAEATLPEPGLVAAADGLAYVMFTSGSTGRPKGVQIPHRAVVNFLNSMRREPGLSPDDVLLAVTTLSFDIAGLELFLPLTTGATVAIAPQECLVDGNLLKRELDQVGATAMQATPATWRLLLEAGWTGNSKLKILIGGEAVPRELVNRLLPRCGSLWNVYGPTETTIWSTTVRLGPGEEPVSIGRPIDNTQVYIVSPSLQPQPVGVPGELLIGGDGVALGYHQRPDWTAERFPADPFRKQRDARVYRTGDLAKWRPDGTIECLGRMDNQVKIRGFRIELGEIEAALARHPGIKEDVVIAREDRPGQKRLVAYFVPAGPAGPATEELHQHVAALLPDYMIPAQFVPLEKLPLTPNGKVNRRALPVPEETAPAAGKPALLPRTAQERTLANIWKGILRRESISVDDDIFDLGGDSILIFQITSRANEAGLAITPAQVFRHRTIAALVALIEPADGGGQSPPSGGPIARVDRATFRKR